MAKDNLQDQSNVPFEVYLHSEDKTHKVKSYAELAEWAHEQLQLWQPARELAGELNGRSNQARDYILHSYGTLHSLAERAANNGDPTNAEQAQNAIPAHLELLQSGALPTATSPIGTRILEEVATNPKSAATRLIWAGREGALQNLNIDANFLTELIRVGIADQTGLEDARVHKSRLTRLHTKWNNRFSDAEIEARDRLSKGIRIGAKALRRVNAANRDHKILIVDHEVEIERLEDTFKERLRLDAPASFWASRRASQTWIAVGAFAAFVVVSGFALFLLTTNWQELIALAKSAGDGVNLVPAIVLTVPVILLLWLLRLVSRVFISSLASARDAAMRSNLIQTYLALTAEATAGMQETDRLLILQALFRPEHAGPEDDAPPPNLLEIIKSTATGRQ